MGVKYILDEGYEFIARIDAGDEIYTIDFRNKSAISKKSGCSTIRVTCKTRQ